MKGKIATALLIAALALIGTSCTNYVNCTCAYDLINEVVDSLTWNSAGQPIYLKSTLEPAQAKTYLHDTVSTTGDCASLNYYDAVGINRPDQGLILHPKVTCWEK